MKELLKKILNVIGVDRRKLIEDISRWSVTKAITENHNDELLSRLREIAPDISGQESRETPVFNDYYELKRRGLQAFQCQLMLDEVERQSANKLTVVDIGDSAGTHMMYLKQLTAKQKEIDTISVNLDERAIEKIKARGLKAILSRAEDLDLGDQSIDIFTSFQMVEHLHNPAIFFRRLAKKSKCNKIVLTVPYVRESRVGLHNLRNKFEENIFAEDEHIFELKPEDWKLLMLHSGWKVVEDRVYYQYPRRIPVLSSILGWFWRQTDFEGFWGAVLVKDTTYSDKYKDWEEEKSCEVGTNI